VAKYDAFGREIGEDTLAGLGGGSTPQPQPQEQEPEPVPRDTPAEDAPAPVGATRVTPPRPQITQRRRGLGRRVGLLAALIYIAIRLFTNGDDDAKPRSAEPPAIAQGGGASTQDADVRTLLHPQQLAAAVAKLGAADLGRPFNIRLAADRIDATLLTADNRIRVVQVSPQLEVRTIATTPGSTAGADPFSFADIRSTAPQRLIRSAARRLHERRRRVDYLVLGGFGGTLQWAVYFKDGRYGVGDGRGRLTHTFSD
jgi:hypothetical protein